MDALKEPTANLFHLVLRIFITSIVLSSNVTDAQNLSSLPQKNLVKSYFIPNLQSCELLYREHLSLIDCKQQDSLVVHNHMTKLIEYLKVNKILGTNGTLLCTSTDGCAAQYRSGTAYYLLSALAASHSIVIQRSIQAPGHGKGENTCCITSSSMH